MNFALIFTCLFFCVTAESYIDRIEKFINDFDFKSIVNELSMKRSKRGTERSELAKSSTSDSYSDYANESSANTSTFGKNNSFDCVTIALDDLHKNLKEVFPKLNDTFVIFKLKSDHLSDASSRRWFSLFNLNSFEKFCSFYNGSRKTLEKCPNSPIKSIVLDTLAIVDFGCLKRYNDVVTYFPCLQKNDEDIYKPCDKKCSSFVTKESDNYNSTNVNNTVITNVFQGDCKYISCLFQCEGPIVESKCKTGAKNLVRDAVKAIFGSLQDLIVKKLKFDWPKSCQDLVDIKI